MGKNSLNNYICHLSWLEKLSPTHTHPLVSILWIFEILRVIIFWVRVTHKMLNLNWEKIHSIIYLSLVMAWETFPYSYTSPCIHLWIFKILWVIIFWARVTHKMLNLNWEKIHLVILSFTCHGLRNFLLLIHIPLKPFVNFRNPMSYYVLS